MFLAHRGAVSTSSYIVLYLFGSALCSSLLMMRLYACRVGFRVWASSWLTQKHHLMSRFMTGCDQAERRAVWRAIDKHTDKFVAIKQLDKARHNQCGRMWLGASLQTR